MGFMDSVQKGLGDAAAASERLVQTTKLKNEIARMEAARRQACERVGETACRLQTEGNLAEAALMAGCLEVQTFDRQIADSRARIAELQSDLRPSLDSSTCGSCGATLPDGKAAFCPGCGAGLETGADGIACTTCGHSSPEGSGFCGGCGRPLVCQ